MKRIIGMLCLFAAIQGTMAQQTFGVGTIHLLKEMEFQGETKILINASENITKEYAPNGKFPMAINSFLVKIDGRNILVDTGLGDKIFDNLASLGMKNEDIDEIFITHMHFDHIGGMLRNGVPAFKNAKIYISKNEYKYWTSRKEMRRVEESGKEGFKKAINVLELYKNQVRLFNPIDKLNLTSKTNLPHGFKAFNAAGHTPGHSVFLLESSGERLMVWGDLVHALAVQMPDPNIAVTYDVDPKKAIESRNNILKFITDHKIPVAGIHVPFGGMGNVERSGTGYKFIPFK